MEGGGFPDIVWQTGMSALQRWECGLFLWQVVFLQFGEESLEIVAVSQGVKVFVPFQGCDVLDMLEHMQGYRRTDHT